MNSGTLEFGFQEGRYLTGLVL